MNLDDKILELLKDTANRFFCLQKEIAQKLNIKRNYYKVLLKLGIEKKPINQTNLGEICGIDKPATSRLVNEMEQEGFIERGAKDGNKKEIFISISNKGREILNKITKLTKELKTKYFSDLDDDEKEQLIVLFEKNLKKG